MKRSLLILLTSIIFAKTNGQITKGNWLVGGNGSYISEQVSNSSDLTKTYELTLTPNIGYFLVDKFAIGISPEFVFFKREYPTSQYSATVRINHLGIGPFLRYYFLPNDKVMNLLIHTNFSLGEYRYYPQNQAVQKESYNSWSLGFGPAIFFNSSVALETIAGYKQVNSYNSDQKNKSFQLLIGLQIHLQKLE